MTAINLKYENPTTITCIINNLTELGKTFSDITDVVCLFKSSLSDSDENSKFNKRLDSGITLDNSNNKINIEVKREDFGDDKLASRGKYFIAIGIEFNNDGVIIEDSDLTSTVYIIEDKIRE